MVIISGYELDVAVSESHVLGSEVSEHPVESGSDVTDNVRTTPVVLTIEGIVSNTPIGPIANKRFPGTVPADDIYALLRSIRTKREPVVVETDLRVYDNMVLESLTIPVNVKTGDAFRFRAQFKQLLLVTNERTTIRVAVPRASKKSNQGNKASPEVEQSKTLDRQKQLSNSLRQKMGLVHDPTLGTDLL